MLFGMGHTGVLISYLCTSMVSNNRLLKRRLLVRGHCDSFSGYGQLFCGLVRGLKDYGFDLVVRPTCVDERYGPLGDDIKSLLWQNEPAIQRELLVHLPRASHPNKKAVLWFTMWESARLKPTWVEFLNDSKAVIVPNAWNASTFSASGVDSPIHKVPLFIDRNIYGYKEMRKSGTFIFGCGGRTVYGGCRKGLDRLVKLFKRAFPDERGVQLWIKTLPDCEIDDPKDSRVRIWKDYLTDSMMADWYSKLHCFVSVSSGEGWGFMQHQAMSIGRPLISARYSGVAEFFDGESSGFPLEYTFEQATDIYKEHGIWGVPTDESVIRSMRIAYGNLDLCESKGWNASKRVSEFTIENTINKLVPLIEKYEISR